MPFREIHARRRLPGGSILLSFMAMVILQCYPARMAEAQRPDPVEAVALHYTVGNYQVAVEAADAEIALTDADDIIAKLCGLKGRSLVQLQRPAEEAAAVFRQAREHDPDFAPGEEWTPEERAAFVAAVAKKSSWWKWVGGLAGVAVILCLLLCDDDPPPPPGSDDLPDPPGPPSGAR